MFASVPSYRYNLAKAKEEMAKSPYPHGFTATSDTLEYGYYTPVCEAIAGELPKIGINLRIKELPSTNGSPLPSDRRLTATSISISTQPFRTQAGCRLDPREQEHCQCQWNMADDDPAGLDGLIAAGIATNDVAKRLSIYGDIMREVAADLPYVPLFVPDENVAVSNSFTITKGAEHRLPLLSGLGALHQAEVTGAVATRRWQWCPGRPILAYRFTRGFIVGVSNGWPVQGGKMKLRAVAAHVGKLRSGGNSWRHSATRDVAWFRGRGPTGGGRVPIETESHEPRFGVLAVPRPGAMFAAASVLVPLRPVPCLEFLVPCVGPTPRYARTRVMPLTWSGRRDSNPRPSPWQGHNLPPGSVLQCADVGFCPFCRPSSDLASALS